MKSIVLLGLCFSAGALVACGGEASKVFGEQSEPCAPTVLSNSGGDAQRAREGADCFLAEVEAGRPVVWDVLVPTVEGDPIPKRYEYDGDTVKITSDHSRDRFASDDVIEERCRDVRRTEFLPEGVDCSPFGGDGFRSDSLPPPGQPG